MNLVDAKVPVAVLAACVLFVPATVHAEEDPGTRPYMVDAVVGFRAGAASAGGANGWSTRWYLGGVPWGDLSPERRDRSRYLGIGGQVSLGRLYVDDGLRSRWRGTWAIGPEARAGVAWGDRSELNAHVYVALSPMLVHIDDDPMLPDAGYHAGVRAAMGVSVPKLRRSSVSLAGEMFEIEDHDFGSASSSIGELQLIYATIAAVGVLLLPDTVEVTFERAGGMERAGLALGYSL